MAQLTDTYSMEALLACPSLPTLPMLSYSTPRKLVNASHVALPEPHDGFVQRKTSPVTTEQVESSLLVPPNFQQVAHYIMATNCIASSSQPPDLPSWTSLRTSGGDGESPSSPESGDNEFPAEISKVKVSQGGQTFSTATTSDKPRSSGSALRPSSSSLNTRISKVKKARFDGVVITSKPSLPRNSTSDIQPALAPRAASSATTFSLVDALRRTFDANKHHDAFPLRQPSVSLDQDDDNTSIVLPTDVETTTEPEDEQPNLNNRLLAPRLPKKHRLTRATARVSSENASESTSNTALVPEVVTRRKPTSRRIKPISYEANAAFVDAALGTVLAPVAWNVEPSFGVKEMDPVGQWEGANAISDKVAVRDEAGGHDDRAPAEGRVMVLPTKVENERPMSTLRLPRKVEPSAVLTPYLSRGAKFRQRLNLMFGEDATVRVDRGAQPRSTGYGHDIFSTPLDEPNGELCPTPSEFTTSTSHHVYPDSTSGESPDSSTEFTSQSPDLQAIDYSTTHNVSGKRQLSQTLEENEGGPMTKKPKVEIGGEQLSGWIVALQRLVKGKVHIKEEALETLSIILAEIESVKDNLDAGSPMTLALREGVKQLSELEEIPFGDRNHLRRRAAKIILTWPFPAF
ncbi:hypothetical protein BS17DRAFT_879873 [Gyrodon lividus]|nr:hypothetical protein BS17DRAFT_879873 [Gyrodon lividus]